MSGSSSPSLPKRLPASVALLALAALLASGCGGAGGGGLDPIARGPTCNGTSPGTAAGGEAAQALEADGAGDGAEDGCVTFLEEGASGPEMPGALQAAPLVYLNRDGGTYRPGRSDSSHNVSSVVTEEIVVPPHRIDDATWDEVVQCVRDRFARFALDVVDEDPGGWPHVEVVIGGQPCQLGLGNRVRGVGPVDPQCALIPTAVVHVFADLIDDPQQLCEVAAHEVGHAAGLEHEYLCEDPMTYLGGCGEKTFQDVSAPCGTHEPRACVCGGTQNSVAHLLGVLGPRPGADVVPPTIAVLSPAPGAVLPGNGTVVIEVEAKDPSTPPEPDDRGQGVSAVKIEWESGGEWTTIDCERPAGDSECRREGARAVFRLPVGEGARSFRVRANDSSGNVTVTEAYPLRFVP